jgi:uncharacterized membrane protein
MKMILAMICPSLAMLISNSRWNNSALIFHSTKRILNILLLTLFIVGCSSSMYHPYFNNPPDYNYTEYKAAKHPKIILHDVQPNELDKNIMTASTITQPSLIKMKITSSGHKNNEENLNKIFFSKKEKQNISTNSKIIKNKKSNEMEGNKDKPRNGWNLVLSIVLLALGIVFAIGGAWSVLLIVLAVLAFLGSAFFFIRWLRNSLLEKKNGKTIGKILLILAGIALLLGITYSLLDF